MVNRRTYFLLAIIIGSVLILPIPEPHVAYGTTYGKFTFDADNDADEFAWTFVSVNGANGLNPEGTNRAWSHSIDTPPSTGIGPCSGEGGSWATESGTCATPVTTDGYVYPEMSSPTAAGDTFHMTFNTVLDASVESWEIVFYTNQRGDTNDSTVVVQINESSGGWVNVGSTFGGSGDPNKVASSGNDVWVQRTVDLSESGANTDSSTEVRILVTQSGASIWQSDYGIDSITITGTIRNNIPSIPTNIGCDNDYTVSGCDIIVDASVDVNATGSTDSDGDSITYNIEASLVDIVEATNSTAVDIMVGGAGTITFVAAGILGWENDNTGTTLAIDFPTHAAGDLLIAIIGLSNAGTNPAQDCTAEIGWTLMTRGFWNSATAGRTCVYYNFDEDNSITNVVFDSDGTTGYVGKGFAYRGVDTTTPIDAGPTFLDNQPNGGTSISPPDVTTVTDNAWVLVITNRDAAPVPMTQSLGYTERSDEGQSGPGDGVIVHMADFEKVTAGLESPGDVSWSGGQESNAMTFALRPEPGTVVQVNSTSYDYIDFGIDFKIVDSIDFKIAIDSYNATGSENVPNSDPDVILEVWNGTVWNNLGAFGLPTFYTGSGLQGTDQNFTISTTDSNILNGWNFTTNQDFRIYGTLMDSDAGINTDQIITKGMFVTLDGKKWVSIGNHTSGPITWDTSGVPEQTNVDFRARAIDVSGSNTWSDWWLKGSTLEISHGDVGLTFNCCFIFVIFEWVNSITYSSLGWSYIPPLVKLI